jgi:hypothetical protein
MDYYKKVAQVDSQDDYILFQDKTVLVYYLCMGISERLKEYEDVQVYEGRYKERLGLMIRNEYSGQKKRFTLNIPRIGRFGGSIGRSPGENGY